MRTRSESGNSTLSSVRTAASVALASCAHLPPRSLASHPQALGSPKYDGMEVAWIIYSHLEHNADKCGWGWEGIEHLHNFADIT